MDQSQYSHDDSLDNFDFDESYHLRSKVLGVLIRDARLNGGRTVEECIKLLRVSEDEYLSWEFGELSPSLPQLELLSYFLDLPISHFWSQKLIAEEDPTIFDPQLEYLSLRHRVIGVLLRIAREESQFSVEEISQITDIDPEQVQTYEMGIEPIPFPELQSLARAVNKSVNYFLGRYQFVGDEPGIEPDTVRWLENDLDMKTFVNNPRNAGFIRLAMAFSQLPSEHADLIARSILNSNR